MGRGGWAVVLLVALSACSATGPQTRQQLAATPPPPIATAPTDEAARFRAEIAALRRINRVAWPILQANAEACEKLGLSGLTIGAAAVNRASFAARRQALAETLLGMTDAPRVLVVPEHTPAYNAGLREGDIVTAVNNAPIVPRADAPQQVINRLALAIKSGGPIRLRVARGASELSFIMAPVSACRFVVNADDDPEIRATVSDDRTIISEGLARFAARDDDLAILLAHEIAHLMVKRTNPETFPDGTPARFSRAASPDAEREADQIGLRLAATAGYPIHDAATVWERLEQASPAPSRTSFAGEHPITESRLAALRTAVAQLDTVQAAQTATAAPAAAEAPPQLGRR